MRFPALIVALLYSVILSAQEKITLLFAGDLMQHQAQIDAARLPDGTYDYTACFASVKEYISAADLAIGNLEVTLGGKPYRGYPAFSAPDEFLYALRDVGFDVLLTANNHSLDRRSRGLERTIQLLDSLAIPHAGTYRTSDERRNTYPLIIHKKGFRIALLNYTYGTNGISVTSPNVVNYIDRSQMQADIHRARSARPDAIIACMHWGNEYQSQPNKEQRELADWLIAQGVTHIIGSHPHVIQPFEVRTDGVFRHVIVYSLGNCISNMSAPRTDGGMLFTLQLKRHVPHITRLDTCYYRLVWTARPKLTGKKDFILYPTDASEAGQLPPVARQKLDEFTRHAHQLLQK